MAGRRAVTKGGAKLAHGHVVLAPVLAEQACFDELGPGDYPTATRLDAQDWAVLLAVSLAAFQPVVQRAGGNTEQPGRFGLGVHLTL